MCVCVRVHMNEERKVAKEEPVSQQGMELNDGLLLLHAELAPLDIRSEIISPSEPAALPAPLQSC